MDKTADTQSIFNRPKPAAYEHLKPLSVYSRMSPCNQKASLHHCCNPFINFKIEIRNNCEKRKLDDSSLDESYQTPAKKALLSKASSPDLGCFVDCSSPPARQDSVNSEIKQTVISQLGHVECGSSEPGENIAPAFDGDVDDILCLNPFRTCTAGIFAETLESYKSPSSNSFQNKPPAVALGLELDRGDGQVKEEGKKKKHLNIKDAEEDKGYISMSYVKDLKTGKDPSESVYPQLLQTNASPMLRAGEVEALEDNYQPESKSEPSCHKQAALSGEHVSFTVSDLDPIVSGPILDCVNSLVEPLEEDVEEVLNIGLPIFESSLCHSVNVKLNAGNEQSRQVSEAAQGELMEPSHECQVTLGGEESTWDTSYETTLPLQVQVKSVVVAPCQHPSSSKPAAASLTKQTPTMPCQKETRTAKCVSRIQRPMMISTEGDLERDKQMYFHSVTRHMNENPGAVQDVMTELLNLMTHVADRTPGANGPQWQHPSDLTRRNYQRRFGNLIPTMALHEWQAKNCMTFKRFAQIPKSLLNRMHLT